MGTSKNHVGKVMIKYKEGEDTLVPCVVYVSGLSATFEGYYVVDHLNNGEISLASDDTLIEFDYKLFVSLKRQWKIRNLKQQLKRMEAEAHE